MNTTINTQAKPAKKLLLSKETIRSLSTAQVGNQGIVASEKCTGSDWCSAICLTSWIC